MTAGPKFLQDEMAHSGLPGTINPFECYEAGQQDRGQRSGRALNRCCDAPFSGPHNVFIECDGSVPRGDRLGRRVRFHGSFVQIYGAFPMEATERPGVENATPASSSSRMIDAKDIVSTVTIRSRFVPSWRSITSLVPSASFDECCASQKVPFLVPIEDGGDALRAARPERSV